MGLAGKGKTVVHALGKKERSKTVYRDFVSKGESKKIERFYSLTNLPSVLGSDSFKQWIKDKFKHLSYHDR
jgi:hypothetical protein